MYLYVCVCLYILSGPMLDDDNRMPYSKPSNDDSNN